MLGGHQKAPECATDVGSELTKGSEKVSVGQLSYGLKQKNGSQKNLASKIVHRCPSQPLLSEKTRQIERGRTITADAL